MTYREDFTLPTELLEQVSQHGFDVLPELIRIVVNAAMQAERQQFLKAAPYQRTPERETYANGYKPKTVQTRVGNITFSVPQVRDGDFYPEALEKGLRSERVLTLTLAEMYVQGVSTRKPSTPDTLPFSSRKKCEFADTHMMDPSLRLAVVSKSWTLPPPACNASSKRWRSSGDAQ